MCSSNKKVLNVSLRTVKHEDFVVCKINCQVTCLKAAYHLANVYTFSEDLLLIPKKLNVFPTALRQHVENSFSFSSE